MCLQDYRVAARTTVRRVTVTPDAGGYARLPDLTRCYWFAVYDAAGNPVPVYMELVQGQYWLAPSDSRFSSPGTTTIFYSPICVGALIRSGLVISTGSPAAVNLVLCEMDNHTYSATIQEV